MYIADLETLSPRERFEHDLFRARADIWTLSEAVRRLPRSIPEGEAERLKQEVFDLIQDAWKLYEHVQGAAE